ALPFHSLTSTPTYTLVGAMACRAMRGGGGLQRRLLMSHVMSWQRDDPSAIIDCAVSALAAGELIALPSDTGCEVMCSASHSNAVTRLMDASRACGRSGMPTIALSSAGQLVDWLPQISLSGMRLARRIWPGPVVLISNDGLEAGLLATLPEATR